MVVDDRHSHRAGHRPSRVFDPQIRLHMSELPKSYAAARAPGYAEALKSPPMGGGFRVAHVPTRLLAASWVAAVLLAVLATAAVAAQGPGLPAAAAPVLARVSSPRPLPAGTVTPLPQPKPPAPKQKATVKVAA